MAKKNTKLFIWLFGFLVVIAGVTGAGVVLLMDSKPVVLQQDPQWLVVDVGPGTAESPGSGSLFADPAQLPPLSTALSAGIRHAASDYGIHSLLLKINGLPGGWAQAEDLRDALAEFRAAGKPCTVWSPSYDTKSYLVASACTAVTTAPEGITMVTGINISQSYYGDALELFGVSANFEHVGDFKSAVEPYERTGPSAEAATATNALLDSLYGSIVMGIAAGRSVDEATVLDWIDNPPLAAADAEARGMIDQRIYEDVVDDTVMGDGDSIGIRRYLNGMDGGWGSSGRVAVLYLEGPIVVGKGETGLFGGKMIGSVTTTDALEDLRKDRAVDAVVLRVSSPGGSGQASDDIWDAVNRLKAVKPVVVSMGDYAASGGYYISMNADHIVAEPTTITGSIGVFGGKMNFAGLLAKAGVTQHAFSRGNRSDILSPSSDFDEDDRRVFRSFLNHFYTVFIDKAATGRGMTPEAMHAVAQGRVWTGAQAVEHGLIDALGGLGDAVEKAAELAELGPGYDIERLPKTKDFFEQLMEEMAQTPDAATAPRIMSGAVPAPLREPMRIAWLLEQLTANGAAVAMIPGPVEIR